MKPKMFLLLILLLFFQQCAFQTGTSSYSKENYRVEKQPCDCKCKNCIYFTNDDHENFQNLISFLRKNDVTILSSSYPTIKIEWMWDKFESIAGSKRLPFLLKVEYIDDQNFGISFGAIKSYIFFNIKEKYKNTYELNKTIQEIDDANPLLSVSLDSDGDLKLSFFWTFREKLSWEDLKAFFDANTVLIFGTLLEHQDLAEMLGK